MKLGFDSAWTRKGDEAHRYLTSGLTMYREIEMVRWLARAEAEARCHGVDR
jgi:hypothetical protein